jgi:hypothetical protein
MIRGLVNQSSCNGKTVDGRNCSLINSICTNSGCCARYHCKCKKCVVDRVKKKEKLEGTRRKWAEKRAQNDINELFNFLRNEHPKHLEEIIEKYKIWLMKREEERMQKWKKKEEEQEELVKQRKMEEEEKSNSNFIKNRLAELVKEIDELRGMIE